MCGKRTLQVRVVATVTSLLVVAFGAAASGCGNGMEADDSLAIPAITTTSALVITGDSDGVDAVFDEVAADLPSMPIYGPTDLPAGATVSADWWPVVEVAGPDAYAGPPFANPRIMGGGADDTEVQVVLQAGEGWLVVMENVRGDLGDVTGETVGEVEGHAATLYDLNGGLLVQWSDTGRWYGVYGRGVAEEVVVATALSMHLIIPVGNQ